MDSAENKEEEIWVSKKRGQNSFRHLLERLPHAWIKNDCKPLLPPCVETTRKCNGFTNLLDSFWNLRISLEKRFMSLSTQRYVYICLFPTMYPFIFPKKVGTHWLCKYTQLYFKYKSKSWFFYLFRNFDNIKGKIEQITRPEQAVMPVGTCYDEIVSLRY